ncbi:hypothetical protein SLA2020_156510 [Shorea laevis]
MGCSLSFKAMFGGLAVPGIILLLLVGALQPSDGRKTKTTLMTTSMKWSEKEEHGKVLGRHKSLVLTELDINYMSKRRVPNGPDPIHNRKRPPGVV